MKKHFLLPAALVALLSATFISCKKDSDPEKSRKDMITGTWTLKATGTDANNNSTLETSEYDSTFQGFTAKETFRADGSGELDVTVGGQSFLKVPFSWMLLNNDQNVRVIQNGDTTVGVITTLNGSAFESYELGSNPREIIILTK